MMQRIPPRDAAAFTVETGALLTIFDVAGEQVADLVCFAQSDSREYLSSGRSIDYAGRLFLTEGDILYSNRSRPMFTIVEDTVGRHDFTLTPCSRDTFRIIYGEETPDPGCQENLERVLTPYDIEADRVPIAFNVFMHVAVEAATGKITVRPPLSKAGDRLTLRAEMPLIAGLTSCSAGQSNNFCYGPIDFTVVDSPAP